MDCLFKICSGKLHAQEVQFSELEGLAKAVQSDATMLSSKGTRNTPVPFDKGSAKLSYQKLGQITKGSKDNTSEKLLEPVKFRSQGSKLKNV